MSAQNPILLCEGMTSSTIDAVAYQQANGTLSIRFAATGKTKTKRCYTGVGDYSVFRMLVDSSSPGKDFNRIKDKISLAQDAGGGLFAVADAGQLPVLRVDQGEAPPTYQQLLSGQRSVKGIFLDRERLRWRNESAVFF
ncbi:KTSC domain-containing protein (plasmid) [Flagellatimonas centrodinii]|uniref:KTSC domain-containing protein n=1 Tax=Flagellatimonas centrodinii TaxID=2806210 RepID=UPI001FEE3801|nr:KTSC domain-containing protein [Flagellatimonas centrodinii]ULQ48353.1 KTSC domain-containing protein [Flagellatimonas centrodinii]